MRELTGVGIAIYMTVFVVMYFLNRSGEFVAGGWFYYLSWMGFLSAMFHSVTWFGVTMKVTPFDLPKWVEKLGFISILLIWGGVSYVLMSTFYDLAHTYINYA